MGAVEGGTTAVVTARRRVVLPFSRFLPVGAVTVQSFARARSPLDP